MQKEFHAKNAKAAKNDTEVLIHGTDHHTLFGEWFLAIRCSLILACLAFFA